MIRSLIITEHPEEIKERIIHELHHSATVITGTGAYSGGEKTVLLCVINSTQVAELTKMVTEYPDSFVIIGSVTRIVGNFKRLDSHGKPETVFFDQGK